MFYEDKWMSGSCICWSTSPSVFSHESVGRSCFLMPFAQILCNLRSLAICLCMVCICNNFARKLNDVVQMRPTSDTDYSLIWPTFGCGAMAAGWSGRFGPRARTCRPEVIHKNQKRPRYGYKMSVHWASRTVYPQTFRCGSMLLDRWGTGVLLHHITTSTWYLDVGWSSSMCRVGWFWPVMPEALVSLFI